MVKYTVNRGGLGKPICEAITDSRHEEACGDSILFLEKVRSFFWSGRCGRKQGWVRTRELKRLLIRMEKLQKRSKNRVNTQP